MGYLPAALRNYLVRLGWSHGDQEIFSTEEMIAAFGLESIGRSPARFDYAKLENLNGHYIRSSTDEDLVEAIEVMLPDIGESRGLTAPLAPALRTSLIAAMPGLKERAKTLVELIDSAAYLYMARPLPLEEKAGALLDDTARTNIGKLAAGLASLTTWDAATTESAVRAFAEANALKLGQIAQPLRAALTGKTTSPPLFDVMQVLGREEVLARLSDVSGPSRAP
jgi:glutamyl-tRNA synthetase